MTKLWWPNLSLHPSVSLQSRGLDRALLRPPREGSLGITCATDIFSFAFLSSHFDTTDWSLACLRPLQCLPLTLHWKQQWLLNHPLCVALMLNLLQALTPQSSLGFRPPCPQVSLFLAPTSRFLAYSKPSRVDISVPFCGIGCVFKCSLLMPDVPGWTSMETTLSSAVVTPPLLSASPSLSTAVPWYDPPVGWHLSYGRASSTPSHPRRRP